MTYFELLGVAGFAFVVFLFFWMKHQLRLVREGVNSVARYRVIKPEKITIVKGNLKECNIKTDLVLMQSDLGGGMITHCYFTMSSETEAAIRIEDYPFPVEKTVAREKEI